MPGAPGRADGRYRGIFDSSFDGREEAHATRATLFRGGALWIRVTSNSRDLTREF